MTTELSTISGWNSVGDSLGFDGGRLGSGGKQAMGKELLASGSLSVSVLCPRSPGPSSLQPSQWCEMEIPRRRVPWLPFPGYSSSYPIGGCQEPTWRVPRYPLPPPPTAGGAGRENLALFSSGHPPGNHGNPAIGTRLAHPAAFS